MNLQIPSHIVSKLRERGLTGNPDEWQFKVVRISGERAYLWFTSNDGYAVLGTVWESLCMADAVEEPGDEKLLSASPLALTMLRGHTSDVHVYPDGSIAWHVGSRRNTVTWRENQAVNQVNKWEQELRKASNNWWIRITQRSDAYKNIANTLLTLASKITKK